MKLVETLNSFLVKKNRSKGSGRVAIAHWDREQVTYFLTPNKGKGIESGDYGVLNYVEAGSPLVALANHFRDRSLSVSKLIVLLSRPELDLLSLNLPPADSNEIPTLVASDVEHQLGDSEEPPTVDFQSIVSTRTNEGGGSQVLAFALTAKERRLLLAQVKESGFQLVAIGSRHLAPLNILRRSELPKDCLAVTVHLYQGEAELALCQGMEPLLLRSIRTNTDEPTRIAEQIWTETQRCLTLLPQSIAESPLRWYVFTSSEVARGVVQAIEERGPSVVEGVDPFLGWTLDKPPEMESISSAANTGTAWDYLHDSLPINLLAPKRSPRPQGPWVRWIAIGGGSVAALFIGFYFLLSDVWQLQTQVEALTNQLNDSKKVTSKYQEKADQVLLVEDWLRDQIDWITILNELSDRLPDGQSASVRRLTAVANTDGGVIDLSLQVAEQEFISQLENRIRGAKYNVNSKQISQNADSVEYPWQFETRVTFPIEPPDSRRYGPSVDANKKPASDSKEKPVAELTEKKEGAIP